MPWWLYLCLSAAVFVFFRAFVDTFRIPGYDQGGVELFADRILHTHFALIASYGLNIVLLLYGAKSLFFTLEKRRFLKKRRSIQALRDMPWQDFELLVAEVYRNKGYDVAETGLGGADGGIDLQMQRGDENIIVQCKRWCSTSIGAPIVREMYGLMNHYGVDGVKIVCVGKFTKEAVAFAEGKPIELVSGDDFLQLLRSVQ